MIGTSDGGFLVVGSANNALTSSSDIEAIKFDSGANIEWVGIYATGLGDNGFAVAEAREGGYLLACGSYSYGDNTQSSISILKISSTGQKIWAKLVGGLSGRSYGYSIAESGDSSRAIYIGG